MPLPVIIDIEASGFGRGSYPIEIGYYTPEGSSYCTLICPEADWVHWDASAESVHGIQRELLLRKGKPCDPDRLRGLYRIRLLAEGEAMPVFAATATDLDLLDDEDDDF